MTKVITAVARKGTEVRAITLYEDRTVLLSVSGDIGRSAGRKWLSPKEAREHMLVVAMDWDMWDFALQGQPRERTLTEVEFALFHNLSKRRTFIPSQSERDLLMGAA